MGAGGMKKGNGDEDWDAEASMDENDVYIRMGRKSGVPIYWIERS